MDPSGAMVSLVLAGISAGIGWLAGRNLERYRSGLQRQRDEEVERLKAELRRSAFEEETQFSHLHDKRCEVTAELYRRMMKAQVALRSRRSELLVAARMSEIGHESALPVGDMRFPDYSGFVSYFGDHRLYLDGELTASLDAMCDRMWALIPKLCAMHGPDASPGKVRYLDLEVVDVLNEITILEGRIEADCRRILGTIDNQTLPPDGRNHA